MDNKFISLEDTVPKYKKKSVAKGQPRADHKHTYETVLLKTYFEFPDYKTGKTRTSTREVPTKVCTICGRIDYVDDSPKYYIIRPCGEKAHFVYEKALSSDALALPKWYADDILGKFAKRGDKPNS